MNSGRRLLSLVMTMIVAQTLGCRAPSETTGAELPPPPDKTPCETIEEASLDQLNGRSGVICKYVSEDCVRAGRVDKRGIIFVATPDGTYDEELVGCVDTDGKVYRQTGDYMVDNSPCGSVDALGHIYGADDRQEIGYIEPGGQRSIVYRSLGNQLLGEVDAPTSLAGGAARLILLDTTAK